MGSAFKTRLDCPGLPSSQTSSHSSTAEQSDVSTSPSIVSFASIWYESIQEKSGVARLLFTAEDEHENKREELENNTCKIIQ